MDERKKHGWPFWFAVGAILPPVLYVASFGPACYLVSTEAVGCEIVWRVYRPLAWIGLHGPESWKRGITRYADLWYVRDAFAPGIRVWLTPFEFEEFETRAE